MTFDSYVALSPGRRDANANRHGSLKIAKDRATGILGWLGLTGYNIVKIDHLYRLVCIINIILLIVAVVTYFMYTSKCAVPITLTVANWVLYGGLVITTIMQFWQMRSRVVPQSNI